ncbi:uncharacterized protein CC84DRAFT_794480 [Paraphaeosphaeria sporulosa]|uniref:Uncharacterized protein n=1 Tax=Paraphaeosphaeria sporulosa TaxID=1460663 RepID=A0A177CCK5_9PLEO|nr:uncharacterized protein CC84DRAFT_794480 [Paraphaeosphaeria sporulosa]OAG04508.1 hypothetical protein CC84DRAFT_794480 [Paraphaeosphaeria sporulosa]
MDSGPGPPQQSPDDYPARERRERTVVAVGISIGVLVLFAGPLCLLYYANWRRKRRAKQNELRDLEGTTAVSHDEKYGTNPFARTGASTLTTTLAPAEELTEAEIARWRELQGGRTETELERLKQDPTSPLNTLPKTPTQPTPEEVLGLDKVSYLQSLPVASSSSSAPGGTPQITVLPSRLPPGIFHPEGESSRQGEEYSDPGNCISPWAVEHQPNPVIFKHLLGSRGEKLGHGEVAAQEEGATRQNEPSPGLPMNFEVAPLSWDQELQHYAQHDTLTKEEERSPESSALEETSGSSPSSSTSSQDSSHPLLSEGSTKDNSQSPTSFRLPDLHQPRLITSGSGQKAIQAAGKLSCTHCDRTFATTGQLK